MNYNAFLNKLFICLFCIFLCLVNERSTDMLEDKSREELDPDLELEEDILFFGY